MRIIREPTTTPEGGLASCSNSMNTRKMDVSWIDDDGMDEDGKTEQPRMLGMSRLSFMLPEEE